MVKDSLYFSCKRWRSVTQSTYKYEEAVKTLNSLQTSAALLQEYRKKGSRTHSEQRQNIEDTKKYLIRSGVTLEQLDTLRAIHVAGTKGKGSVCAFCDSLLRQYGLKTGFFSSPHLVAVRERIRINGKPLSQEDFTQHFWNVYNKLHLQKENDNDMPPYFKFLTIMAFNVFLYEKVDVAIVEVGIGGEYDCTNVLRKVQAIGITSLGLDHTSLLGDTLEKIAWQKAGIMKEGAVAVTVPGQPQETVRVLQTRSEEKQCALFEAPPLEAYDWPSGKQPDLSVAVQKLNASLALQLTAICLGMVTKPPARAIPPSASLPIAPTFPVSCSTERGLTQCQWPGRMQVLRVPPTTYFLDGAHTTESMNLCSKWFQQTSCKEPDYDATKRILIFNATGDRDANQLLAPLTECHFDLCIFCPNLVSKTVDSSSDQANLMTTLAQQLERCDRNCEAWLSLCTTDVCRLDCMQDALSHVRTLGLCHVLITGSLHLVGAALSLLDPEEQLLQS